MRKKRMFITMLMMMLSIISWAAPRTAAQAKKIAAEQARKLGITVSEPQLLQKASPRKAKAIGDDMTAYYYVFNNDGNKGFIIVSGDDLMPEIVGYSDKGTFSEEKMPDNMKAFLTAYCATIDKIVSGDNVALDIVNELAARRAGKSETTVIVEPLLKEIQWNQGVPYNHECPLYDGVNRAVTGCVATATAQIMKYYNWPEALTKDIPAYNYKGDDGEIDVEGVKAEGRTYDWANMLNDYGDNYSLAQAEAVARLMSDVGRSMEMIYGSESGAFTDSPYSVLPEYFGYDPDFIQVIERNDVSLARWMDILKNDLDDKRPVYLGGQSLGGGHAFVCDGYNSADFFHINWGWGGYLNGFFDISVLSPGSTSGIGASLTFDGYDMGVMAIVGIRPDNNQEDEAQWKFPALRVVPDEDVSPSIINGTRTSVKDKFSVKTNWNIVNWSEKTFNGYVGIAILGDDGKLTIINSSPINGMGSMFSISPDNLSKNLPIDYAFPVGKSTLVAVEKATGDEEWTIAKNAINNCITVEATETKLTFSKENPLTVNITNNEIEAGTGSIDLDIMNNTKGDFYGRLYIYATDTPKDFQPTENYDAYIPLGLDKGRSIKKTANLSLYDIDKKHYILVFDDRGTLLYTKEVTTAPSSKPTFMLMGYKLNGIPYDQLTETDNQETYWGYREMPLIHNAGTPELTLDVINLGPKSTFKLKVYNKRSDDLAWDWYQIHETDEEIDCGETNSIVIPSGDEGEGLCVWTICNYVSEDDHSFVMNYGKINFGIDVNYGKYNALFAYNDGVDTGVNNITMDNEDNGAIYNLSGQRLKAAKAKGIYIIGKKKVVVK